MLSWFLLRMDQAGSWWPVILGAESSPSLRSYSLSKMLGVMSRIYSDNCAPVRQIWQSIHYDVGFHPSRRDRGYTLSNPFFSSGRDAEIAATSRLFSSGVLTATLKCQSDRPS
jgi:hypothetical protein